MVPSYFKKENAGNVGPWEGKGLNTSLGWRMQRTFFFKSYYSIFFMHYFRVTFCQIFLKLAIEGFPATLPNLFKIFSKLK